MSKDLDRFWSKVRIASDTDCWQWQRYTDRDGYGQFYVNGRRRPAHRWLMEQTQLVDPDMFVCHHCDNPGCVNPHHLFLGTPAENTQDMIQKQRQARGERKPNARLTPAAVQDIRSHARKGYHGNIRQLAEKYDVSISSIHHVLCGLKWQHV